MSTPRVTYQSVKRTNVPHDTFIEEPSGTKFVVNNRITIKYPAKVVQWQKKLDDCETLLFKAENDSSLNVNVKSLKGNIYKFRRYLSVEGAYEEDCSRNNYNSKSSNKARGVLEKLSKMWNFDIDYDASKDEIVELICQAASRRFMRNERQRELYPALRTEHGFLDMDLESDDDDDSTYVPSVQSDDSEDNRNNVRQMARQRYDYESDDDSTYVGSNSTIGTFEESDEEEDYEFA